MTTAILNIGLLLSASLVPILTVLRLVTLPGLRRFG
jgi:hypothetical protein